MPQARLDLGVALKGRGFSRIAKAFMLSFRVVRSRASRGEDGEESAFCRNH